MNHDEIIMICIEAAETMDKQDIPEVGREVHIARSVIGADTLIQSMAAGVTVVLV